MYTVKNKKFEWKVYSINWDLKFTINPTEIKNRLVFDSILNSGQWELKLVRNKPVKTFDIIATDIIRIYQIDKQNPDWRNIYTWIVQNIIRNITASYEEIVIPLLWLWSIFNYKTFNWSKTDSPWNIMSDMVDLINLDYNLFTKNIDTSGSDIKLDLEHETALSIVNKVKQASTFDYRICANWEVYFKQKEATPIHVFELWEEVYKVEAKQNTEKLCNKLILKYDNSIRIYEDLTSQTTYWIREKYIVDESIKQNDSADEFWNQYIINNKDFILETIIEINDIYDIETIKPWDTISIYWTLIDNLQIVKTKYYMDWITLYLEKTENFASEFNYLKW